MPPREEKSGSTIWISEQHTSTERGGGCVREIRWNDEQRGDDELDEWPFIDAVERLIEWGGDLVEAKFLPSPWLRSIIWIKGI